MNLTESVKAARRVSAPIIAISDPDNAAAIRDVLASFNEQPPSVQWDCVGGITACNKQGQAALQAVQEPESLVNPVEALMASKKLPGRNGDTRGTMLFMHNAHRFLADVGCMQAVWNLRDLYKQDQRTLVLLGTGFAIPAELSNDVVTLDQAMPGESEIEEIAARIYAAAQVKLPKPAEMALIVDATTGLAPFMIEQTIAMSLSPKGIDIENLWARKRAAIEQTPGLTVWKGKESFDNIGGLTNLKLFLRRYLSGKRRPRVIVYMDEIEKSLAGFTGDNTGVTQDQVGCILKFMQDERADGIVLYGPAGTGKSNIAKAAGNETNVPVIAWDMGAMKSSHVGDTEQATRNATKVLKAMGQDRILFIATCNSMVALPPELRRRFKSGTFFLDLPDKAARRSIWSIYSDMYLGKTNKPKHASDLPDDEGWTGAEIATCCEYAASFGCSLKEAAQYIVPVSRSASEVVEGLRKNASGRYINADAPGVYQFNTETAPKLARAIFETE